MLLIHGVLMVTLIGSGRPASGAGMRLAGLWGFGGVGEGSELSNSGEVQYGEAEWAFMVCERVVHHGVR